MDKDVLSNQMPDFYELRYIDRAKKYLMLTSLLEAPWTMLLDSGSLNLNSDSKIAKSYRRFDILVTKPTLKLECISGELCISHTNYGAIAHDFQCPFIAMRELLRKYDTAQSDDRSNDHHGQYNLPFSGGWLGYISYDYGLEISKAIKQPTSLKRDSEDQYNAEIPLIQMGLYQSAIIFDHEDKTTRLYNFGLGDEAFKKQKSTLIKALDQFDADAAQYQNPIEDNEHHSASMSDSEQLGVTKFRLLRPFRSNITQQQYAECFQRIQSYIFDGDCYQVNFSQQFSTQFEGSSVAIYERLAKANNAPFSAYLNFGHHKILSLSPERFIESDQGKVKTQPIKGTRARSEDSIKDQALANELVTSEKDKAENLMIVDLLRNDLSKTAAKGSVEVAELFGLYHFESVHHLISTITSTLADDRDAFDILKTTLPGGSITGAPKIRAMQIIDELEPNKRGIYCGSIGYIDFNGKMDSNICIRTLVINGNNIVCSAGGGLVADSVQNLEYQETFDKLSKIIPVLENDKQKCSNSF